LEKRKNNGGGKTKYLDPLPLEPKRKREKGLSSYGGDSDPKYLTGAGKKKGPGWPPPTAVQTTKGGVRRGPPKRPDPGRWRKQEHKNQSTIPKR